MVAISTALRHSVRTCTGRTLCWLVSNHLPRDGHHNYLTIPEIVADVARSCGVDLAQRFQDATTPCVVKFRTTGVDTEILHAGFWYIHGMLHDGKPGWLAQCDYDGRWEGGAARGCRWGRVDRRRTVNDHFRRTSGHAERAEEVLEEVLDRRARLFIGPQFVGAEAEDLVAAQLEVAVGAHVLGIQGGVR